ncbi:MAG: hypothetical protein FWD11_08090 [Micrococcales bacterium]|nr:hypothetical protein [Micrococcales bacterium]
MADDTPTGSAVDIAQTARIAAAPAPTDRTLRQRQNVLIQTRQFVRINLRMIRVIRAKHF